MRTARKIVAAVVLVCAIAPGFASPSDASTSGPQCVATADHATVVFDEPMTFTLHCINVPVGGPAEDDEQLGFYAASPGDGGVGTSSYVDFSTPEVDQCAVGQYLYNDEAVECLGVTGTSDDFTTSVRYTITYDPEVDFPEACNSEGMRFANGAGSGWCEGQPISPRELWVPDGSGYQYVEDSDVWCPEHDPLCGLVESLPETVVGATTADIDALRVEVGAAALLGVFGVFFLCGLKAVR